MEANRDRVRQFAGRKLVVVLVVLGLLVYVYPLIHDQTLGFVGTPFFFASQPEQNQSGLEADSDSRAVQKNPAKQPRFKEGKGAVAPQSPEEQRRFNLLNAAAVKRRGQVVTAATAAVGIVAILAALKSGIGTAMTPIMSKIRADNTGGVFGQVQVNSSIPGGAPNGTIQGRSDEPGEIDYFDGVGGLWRNLLFQPVVTVSGYGQANLGPNVDSNNGAMFGVDTTETPATNGAQSGCNFAGASSMFKKVVFMGTFTQLNYLALTASHNGLTLDFTGATIIDGGTTGTGANGIIRASSANNLTFIGTSVTFTGTATCQAMFKFLNCTTVTIDLVATISGFTISAGAFIYWLGSTGYGITVKGDMQTGDSSFFLSTSLGGIDISGFRSQSGGYTTQPGPPPIYIKPGATGPSTVDIRVHDIVLYGGALSTICTAHPAGTGTAPINIAGTTTYPFYRVTVDRIICRNWGPGPLASTIFRDGIDLQSIVEGTVSNFTGDNLGDGIAFANSTNVALSNLSFSSCRFYGLQIGDPSNQTSLTTGIAVSNLVASGCGQWVSGLSGAVLGGIGVVTAPGGTIQGVTFTGCYSSDEGASLQPYGISFTNGGTPTPNGTVTAVTVTGGHYDGYVGNVYFNKASGVISAVNFHDVDNVNNTGVIATPFFNSGLAVGMLYGVNGAAGPSNGDTYVVQGQPLYISSSGGSPTITVQDNQASPNTVFSGSSMIRQRLEIGYTITWSTLSGVTVVVEGA